MSRHQVFVLLLLGGAVGKLFALDTCLLPTSQYVLQVIYVAELSVRCWPASHGAHNAILLDLDLYLGIPSLLGCLVVFLGTEVSGG